MTVTADIRAAIKAKILALPSPGTVHDYERYRAEIGAFKALFVSGSTLKAWIIRRVAARRVRPAVGRLVVTTTWQIRTYQGLDDAAASEKAFDDLVDAFADAIRDDDTLGGVVRSCAPDGLDGIAGVQLDDSGPVMFAGVLAHAARLRLATVHFE